MLRLVEVDTNSNDCPAHFNAKMAGVVTAGKCMFFIDVDGKTKWIRTSPVQYIRMIEANGDPISMYVKTKNSEYRIKVIDEK